MPDIRIGTSGWAYDHWKGDFYPAELPRSRWFAHYVSQFDTVELNTTFYSTPRETAVRRWHDETPGDFLFAVKGSRYISHNKKLLEARDSLKRQDDAIAPLSHKLGPILWQLPEKWQLNLERLRQFVALRPPGQRWCFEFRHQSCFCPDVYALFREFDITLVWADMAHHPFAAEVTGSFLYGRLHGHEEAYASRYSDSQLQWWHDRLFEASAGWRDIFVYFDNDAHGHAPHDALRLREMMTS